MMAFQDASARIILLWKTWSIHGFVLFSLCLQIVLLFGAPFRKKTKNIALVVLVWLAYQLVSTAISRALALILVANNEQGQQAEQVDLYSFWSAFLILHYGGPDTITALAMEDNNLWRRSALQLTVYISAIVNAALALQPKTLQLKTLLLGPKVYISTVLVMLAGFIKSAERIMSLSNASYELLQKSLVPIHPKAGPDYAAIVEAYEQSKYGGTPVKFQVSAEAEAEPPQETTFPPNSNRGLEDNHVATIAYDFFEKFRGMYVDMVFCCHDRKKSRDFFLGLSSSDVFRVMETEMKLAYEAFYTKTPTFFFSKLRFFRCFPFILELTALILWSLEQKHRFRPVDVKITTILLVGAVLVDVVTIIRSECSDWKIGAQEAAGSSSRRLSCLTRLFMCIRRRRWVETLEQTSCSNRWLRILCRQWSESISQFNLIDYCIYERPQWRNHLYTLTGSKDMMDGHRYVSETCLTNHLRDFIFRELRSKSVMAEDLDIGEEVSLSRGSWILRCMASNDLDPAAFQPWIMDVEYDESLLIWHVATELCYQTETAPDDVDEQSHREFSKILSDYMFYLLIRQPKLMSEIAPMAEVIFHDTSHGARQFFREVMPSSLPNAAKSEAMRKQVHKEACKLIMEVTTKLPPDYLKCESKSVLIDAYQLAKKLNELEMKGVDRWMFISRIWVELLCYAAAQSPARVHVLQLCAGGELVTLVRLLMLHLGLSNQFRKAKESIPRSELVVGM